MRQQRRGESALEFIGGVVVVMAIIGGVVWFLNKDKGAGPVNLPGGVQVRSTDDDARRRHNAEVAKMQQCLDDFNAKDGAIVKYWNQYAGDNRYDKKSVYQECIKMANAINPYSPAGVNPELAEAIRKVKDAHMALYNAALVDTTRVFTANQQEPYRLELNRLRDDVSAVVNRLQAKYNSP